MKVGGDQSCLEIPEECGMNGTRRILLDVSNFRLSGTVETNGERKTMSLWIPRLRLHSGEISAVIGGSGCGKSVLLGLLMGYPSFGIGGLMEVSAFSMFGGSMPGNAFRSSGYAAIWRRKMQRSGGLFYLPQVFPMAKTRGGYTLSSMVQVVQAMSAPSSLSIRDTKKLLDEVFARHRMRDALPKKLDSLSGGERRRTELLARLVALRAARRPAILILDEPTTGFDPANARLFIFDVRKMVDELVAAGIPVAAIISTHEMKCLDDVTEDGHPVIDRVCVVNRDSSGPGNGDCTVVFDGCTGNVFPVFFGSDGVSSSWSFAADGDRLFSRIRELESKMWVDRWMQAMTGRRNRTDVS